MRKRFNPNRIASSENYKEPRKTEYIIRTSDNKITEVQKISEFIQIRPRYFVSCFGELVEISETEAITLEQTIKIIRK